MNHDMMTMKLIISVLILIIIFSICGDLILGICFVIALMMIYESVFFVEDFNSVEETLTPRQKRLNFLNKDRGKLGRFLVNCGRCGRQGILDKIAEVSKSSPDCPYALDWYNDDQYNGDENQGSANRCPGCPKRCNQTMSFFNNKYIDTAQTFCYNCLLDTDTHMLIRNYKDYPSVNGPPGTNSFTH